MFINKCPCIYEIYMEVFKNKGALSSTYSQMIQEKTVYLGGIKQIW